jgi:hypothetical protein
MNRALASALALATIFVLPFDGQAQSARTDEGVAAFVQGDYARAVEILKPAAERWRMPYDNTAAFFMALMYDNGLGVPRDPLKACALLLRTSVWQKTAPPLIHAVQVLADDFNSRLGPEQMGRCMLLADIGFNRTAQKATFTLAVGHWISIELSPERRDPMAQIEYGGKLRDVESIGLPNMAGVQYLPFTVTELTSLRPRPERRHFLEAFVFLPVHANRWNLMWFVFEVVRDTLVQVTAEELQTVDGDEPPRYEVTDLRRLASVRVNADGDAEWVVLADADRRIDVIETPAEREEMAAERVARLQAEKEVDWKLRRPPNRAPSLGYSGADSAACYGPAAYGWSRDRTEGITLLFGDQDLDRASPSTFILGRSSGFAMTVHVYDAPQQRFPFCTDVSGDEGEVWRGVAGTATIEVAPTFRVREPEVYRATIRLTGAEFVSATGARVRQSQPITLSTIVNLAR